MKSEVKLRVLKLIGKNKLNEAVEVVETYYRTEKEIVFPKDLTLIKDELNQIENDKLFSVQKNSGDQYAYQRVERQFLDLISNIKEEAKPIGEEKIRDKEEKGSLDQLYEKYKPIKLIKFFGALLGGLGIIILITKFNLWLELLFFGYLFFTLGMVIYRLMIAGLFKSKNKKFKETDQDHSLWITKVGTVAADAHNAWYTKFAGWFIGLGFTLKFNLFLPVPTFMKLRTLFRLRKNKKVNAMPHAEALLTMLQYKKTNLILTWSAVVSLILGSVITYLFGFNPIYLTTWTCILIVLTMVELIGLLLIFTVKPGAYETYYFPEIKIKDFFLYVFSLFCLVIVMLTTWEALPEIASFEDYYFKLVSFFRPQFNNNLWKDLSLIYFAFFGLVLILGTISISRMVKKGEYYLRLARNKIFLGEANEVLELVDKVNPNPNSMEESVAFQLKTMAYFSLSRFEDAKKQASKNKSADEEFDNLNDFLALKFFGTFNFFLM